MSAPSGVVTAGRRVQAPFGRRSLRVVANARLGAYRVITVADRAEVWPRAGQFYMLASVERWGAGERLRPYLPRAFSVLRARAGAAGRLELDFLLEDVGPGTQRLSELEPGERLWLTGPLGCGFALPAAAATDAPPAAAATDAPALLVGGGVGIAPLAILHDELASAGMPATALLGFRDREHALGAELIAAARVATDDGSVGHHGLVTDLLAAATSERAAAGQPAATVYACGPPPMLEAVRAHCARHGIAAQLALEAPMACGYGACYGCVVATADGGYRRVCVDGPVFDAVELAAITGEGHA